MSNLRTGIYGQYYGSFYNESVTLSQEQQEVNALYINSYLQDNGWTVNAIAGLLGNATHESALNSGRWQGDKVNDFDGGYGLTQWTPSLKYIEWCANNGYTDPSEMDNNLARIIWEVETGNQYFKTSQYNYNFKAFTQSTKTPYELACAFAWNYERSAVVLWGTEAQKEALRQKRGGSAEAWYKFLTGVEPEKPSTPIVGAKSGTAFKFLLMCANRRRKQWKK